MAFCCGFVPQHIASRQGDNLSFGQYTEALKSVTIHSDTTKAVMLLRSVLEHDSVYAPALALMARLSTNNAERAEYAKRAYYADTTNTHYIELYRQALVDMHDYASAIPLSYRLVERSTEPSEYYMLAAMLEHTQRDSEAIAILDSAYIRLGRIAPLSRLRQYLLIKNGRMLEAEQDALKGIEEAPYLADSYVALAEIYAGSKRDSLALATYLRGLEVDKESLELQVSLNDFYLRRNQTPEYLSSLDIIFANKELSVERKIAQWKNLVTNTANYRRFFTHYDTLIKRLFILYPENREVVDLYIRHLIAAGDIEQALKHSKEAITRGKSPQLEDYNRVIGIEEYLNRPDSVAHYLNLAIDIFPHNVGLLQMQGSIALHKREYDKAIAYQHEALKYADNDTLRSSLWGSIGDIEHERKEAKRCYKAYDKALRYFSNNAVILNNYAYYLSLENRDLERALTMITQALALSQNNATYLDTMAWVLYKLGRYAEAKRYMQQALSLDRSNSAELSLHYGDILYALGEEFMAKTYWRKALERGADKEEIERRFLPDTEDKKR